MSIGDKEKAYEGRRTIGAGLKRTGLSRLGNRLRKARQDSGMTQSEVAEELGITAQTVRNWEAGRHEPSAKVISDLAERYRVSEEKLLGDLDAPSGSPVSAKPKFPYDRVPVDAGKLSEARRGAGLTQERVSGMTGLSLSAIRSYERGSARPATRTLEVLAGIYGRPAGWFMPRGNFTEEERKRFEASVSQGTDKEARDDPVTMAYGAAKVDLSEEEKRRIAGFIRFTHQQALSGRKNSIRGPLRRVYPGDQMTLSQVAPEDDP